MGHSDSRPRPPLGLWIPRGRYPFRMPRRASQVPRLILRRAPPSTTPGGPAGAYARFFPAGGRLYHIWKVGRRHLSVTRPNQVRLRWGSRLRCRGRTTPPRLSSVPRKTGLTPRVWLPSAGGRTYMVNEQLPWLKPSIQQDQPGLAWRDQIDADLPDRPGARSSSRPEREGFSEEIRRLALDGGPRAAPHTPVSAFSRSRPTHDRYPL